MIRTILMVLALVVLVVIGLFYMNILHWPGGGQPIQANPVEVKMETRQVNVQVPVVGAAGEAPPANAAQPLPQGTPGQAPPPQQTPTN